jgi:hypothetical protein
MDGKSRPRICQEEFKTLGFKGRSFRFNDMGNVFVYQVRFGEVGNMKEKFILLIGVTLLFTSFIVMGATYIAAYSNESKTVIVDINSKGEANLEMWILLPVTAAFGSLALAIALRGAI